MINVGPEHSAGRRSRSPNVLARTTAIVLMATAVHRVAAVTAGDHLPAAATMSAGVAAAVVGETIDSVIGRADRALYRAKSAGSDRLLVDRERHLSPS